jgi:hypothetical protein
MKKYFQLAFIVSALAFLLGCTQTNIHLPDSFWQEKRSNIAVAYANPPVPTLHKLSVDGMVDLSISPTGSDIESYLSHLNISCQFCC